MAEAGCGPDASPAAAAGPTADDMTVEVAARCAGASWCWTTSWEQDRQHLQEADGAKSAEPAFDSIRAANRKQAMIPAGSPSDRSVGTAPGLVVPGRPAVIVLPGHRASCSRYGARPSDGSVQDAIVGRTTYRQGRPSDLRPAGLLSRYTA